MRRVEGINIAANLGNRESERKASRLSGRPRSERSRLSILREAYELLKHTGVQAISTHQISQAAGVSTATIYRWWQTKEALLLDAYLHHLDEEAPLTGRGSPLKRLRKHLIRLSQIFEGDHGRISIRLLMAIQEDQVLRDAFFDRVYLPRLRQTESVIQEAIEIGELPRKINIQLFMDMIMGPMIMQLLLRHQSIGKFDLNEAFNYAISGAIAMAKIKPRPRE